MFDPFREPSRQHGTQRHHNATPIITTNNDSNVSVSHLVVNDHEPVFLVNAAALESARFRGGE